MTTNKEEFSSPDPTNIDLQVQLELVTNAFDKHRGLLVGFANCADRDELGVVRDGWRLGLARDICPEAYDLVQRDIITHLRQQQQQQQQGKEQPQSSSPSPSPLQPLTVINKLTKKDSTPSPSGAASGFANTVQAARASPFWEALVTTLLATAMSVDCELDVIWDNLETGRLEWLQAASGAHGIKMTLREGLKSDDGAMESQGDVSDAKMIWMYALCRNIPSCQEAATQWAAVVQLPNPDQPLVGYQTNLWDPRKDEWRPVDIGAQKAAERGGSSIEAAWNAE